MLVIYIKDLAVKARHGINPDEKQRDQQFIFNVELTVDDSAGAADDIADTVDYEKLRQTIIDTARDSSFNLIEKLAREIAGRVLEDRRVKKVSVRIDKPDAFDNGTPGVIITR